ncbi:helicase HerA-like domain-containing protein [Acinetobacter baumannii]|nr:helicase HerA-like domain-containing protein [Acinetobacter baumannii]
MGTPIVIAKNINDTSKEIVLLSQFANRHGLIAGATGTGKTVTLKVLAESFLESAFPSFLPTQKVMFQASQKLVKLRINLMNA